MAMKIDKDSCVACGECEAVCPSKAISPAKGVYAIDPAKCTECAGEADSPQCMDACPDGCIDYLVA